MSGGDVERAIAQQVMAATKAIEEQVEGELDKFANLEVDDLEKLRKERRDELKLRSKKVAEWKTQGHGEYSEIGTEKDFFEVSKKSNRVVCHFYRESTFRCKIVDKHLNILAQKHVETKFCKIDVEKCPFLVERLKIKIIPVIVMMIDSQIIGRIIGFTDLGNRDDFSTEVMEWRLGVSDVIEYNGDKTSPPDDKAPKKTTNLLKKTIRGTTRYDQDEDDEEQEED